MVNERTTIDLVTELQRTQWQFYALQRAVIVLLGHLHSQGLIPPSALADVMRILESEGK